MSSSSDNNNNTEERYPFLSQYSRDLERSQNETAPEVPYTSNAPTCKDCNTPFSHDFDERKYRCNFCIISVREVDIEYLHHNKNRLYKDLAERAAMSPEEQRQENIRTSAIRNNRARLSTQTYPHQCHMI